MDVTILGSAAAEGVPSVFCVCDVCREARARGGREMRLRTAYALGGRIRVDLGPDTIAQEHRWGLATALIRHLFITHAHEDHFEPWMLYYRRQGFARVPPEFRLKVYAEGKTRARAEEIFARYPDDYFLDFVDLEPFAPVTVAEEDLTAHPLRANHMDGELALFYLFRVGARHVLVANDTGYFPEDTWAYLEKLRPRLDLAFFDCTMGDIEARDGHMGRTCVMEVVERLRAGGLADAETTLAVNHFSHNGHMLHTDYEAYFAPRGVETCWDGRTFAL